MGDFSAMTVAQHVVARSSSPYVPFVQSPINPSLDAREKNDLSKLKVRIASSMHFFSDGQFTLILVLTSYLSLKICCIYSGIRSMLTKFPNAELKKGSRDFFLLCFSVKMILSTLLVMKPTS